jgi:tetratricopeptide (TPR) repeat protein
MKRIRPTGIFLLALLLWTACAATARAAVETGGVDGVFSYGAGLRALGMGGAFTAMRQDPSLAYWNPGAMSFNQHKEISLFGTRTIASSYYFSGFYTNPTVNVGTLSVGALGLYTNGIESYDEFGSPITGANSSYLHYQILLSYGYNFKWGLGVGATAKIEQMRITDYKGTGAGFDLGAIYSHPKLPWLSIGVVVQDVYGTGIKLLDEFEKPTRIYKAGIATNFPIGAGKKNRLSIALDSRFYRDNYNPAESRQLLYDFSLGTELSFAEQLMIRAGYRNFSPQAAFQDLPRGLSVGLGVRRWGFGLDYAVTFEDSDWQGPLELLMRIGLSYRIGQSIDEKKAADAEKIKKQIDEGIRKATESYDGKLSQLEEQYTQDQERITQEIEQTYQEKVATLEQASENQRQQLTVLKAQSEADKQRSLEQLTQQYNKQRAELELQLSRDRAALTQRLNDLQRQYEQQKRVSTGDIVLEKQKAALYEEGLILFGDGKYPEALDVFNRLSALDPAYLKVQEYVQRTKSQMKNVEEYSPDILQIYYKGLDLFIQKKYKEAITEWTKILKNDPYNKLALRNIREAEERLRKLSELGIKE